MLLQKGGSFLVINSVSDGRAFFCEKSGFIGAINLDLEKGDNGNRLKGCFRSFLSWK